MKPTISDEWKYAFPDEMIFPSIYAKQIQWQKVPERTEKIQDLEMDNLQDYELCMTTNTSESVTSRSKIC